MILDELSNLAASLTDAGYLTSIDPSRPPLPGAPAVYVGAPSMTFPYSACAAGPVAVTVPVTVVAAGADRDQVAALYDAVDAVAAAVPIAWTPVGAEPDPTDGVPAYTFTLTKESRL